MSKHPGSILFEDFMTPLGINANRLAKSLGVNRSTVGRLIAGTQRITPEMAERLGRCFGVPAKWWLLMQAEFDAEEISARPRFREDVSPIEISPDVFLTPNGVLRLDHGEEGLPQQSIPRAELDKIPESLPPRLREVRVVRYGSGSVALVGDEP